MRPLAFTAFAVFAAATLAAAPVSAQEWRQHQGGGYAQQRHGAVGNNGQWQNRGGGGGGERRHGGGGVGFAAPALILGLGAAAVAAGIANSQRGECGHYERVYDDWGNYRGRRWVDEC